MPTLYVAKSQALITWGSDVGLSKNLYKVGVAEAAADTAIQALNDAAHAGQTDWRLVKKQPVGDVDEATVLARLAQKERMVDPKYYPRIKGAQGIFKVRLANVENRMLVKKALAGEEETIAKVRPQDIADYLLENALELAPATSPRQATGLIR